MPRTTRHPLLALGLSGLLAAAAVAGCTPVGVAVGAGAAGVTAAQKEKGFAASVDDTRPSAGYATTNAARSSNAAVTRASIRAGSTGPPNGERR